MTREHEAVGARKDGLLTTGDMARLSGSTLRTVRFYEEAGILRSDCRSAGGHRLFPVCELDRLQFITDMRAAGLSLDEIRALLQLKAGARQADRAATITIEALSERISQIDQKVATLQRVRHELSEARRVLGDCEHCERPECFPDHCADCAVMTDKSNLPQAVHVLWRVPRSTR